MRKILMVMIVAMFSAIAYSQEVVKYDYAEIVVLQKVAKKKSDFREIYLNSTTSGDLDKGEISKLENNSSLLKFMNSKNWEFVQRLGSQASNSGPIWINYIFRKKHK